jgi:hypothetical protein
MAFESHRFTYLFFGLIPEFVFPSRRLSSQFPQFISADADTLSVGLPMIIRSNEHGHPGG